MVKPEGVCLLIIRVTLRDTRLRTSSYSPQVPTDAAACAAKSLLGGHPVLT